ncbi:MAG: hypothetical protein E7454_00835 [Ruminococcaceae bacterium]|nr:hypothetical protein [Oscillospiraceae bacterium]
MNTIEKMDSNFKIESKLDVSDIKFYNVRQAPFQVFGLIYEDGRFRRCPKRVAETVSEPVTYWHTNTAGGRVRFKTDSPYVAIYAVMPEIKEMSHFAKLGSAGFDLYVADEEEKYMGSFIPPVDLKSGYESIVRFNSFAMREITINFPPYSNVGELHIGISESAQVCPPAPYSIQKPIVYYGSSITQGACASRPGNSYTAMVSRRLNADYINLGFSGSAKGETEMAEYIRDLDMSAFVYDYDYNAPSVEHLKETHEKMFQTIRRAHPDIPILMLSRPKFYINQDEELRREVVYTTYKNALADGDGNVYFLDGKSLMALAGNDGSVDTCHPNDWGFASMAKAIGDVLEDALKDK